LILGLLDVDYSAYIGSEHSFYNNLDSGAKKGIVLCPICGGFVCMHGTYKRKVILSEFDTKIVEIIQVRCKKCRKVHAVLPGFIAPNKQYNYNIIKNTIEGKGCETCTADESTIRRWRVSVK